MHHFDYKNGTLHAENIAITTLAEKVGTPFYCYSRATLTRHYQVFSKAFSDIDSMVCYALKANSNQAVIKTLANLGCGADVVSGGELKRALLAGIPAEKIMYSGVGKTQSEIDQALDANIMCFNVESEAELIAIDQRAALKGKRARISIRINPDVKAGGNDKISTGRTGDKFGIDWENAQEAYALAGRLSHLQVTGIDMHIGSQIETLAPYEHAFSRLSNLVNRLRNDGHCIDHIDLGGGLGIPYKYDDPLPPDPSAYSTIVKRHVSNLGCKVIFEPGRLIAGNAGIVVGEIHYTKSAGDKTILISDLAMNDLVRPTLYEAWHEILPVQEAVGQKELVFGDLVGPVCETGDYVARNRDLPDLKAKDLFAVMSAGAYGAVQAGTYNTRALIPEVLVDGDRYENVRPRISVDDIIAFDRLPDWL